mgnify:FL=1
MYIGVISPAEFESCLVFGLAYSFTVLSVYFASFGTFSGGSNCQKNTALAALISFTPTHCYQVFQAHKYFQTLCQPFPVAEKVYSV